MLTANTHSAAESGVLSGEAIDRDQLNADIAELLDSEHLDEETRRLERWTPSEIAGADEKTVQHLAKGVATLQARGELRNTALAQTLQDTPCWLLWRYGRPRNEGGKPTKVPISPATLQPTDGATTVGKVLLEAALSSLNPDSIELGVTLGGYGDLQLSGFDIDNCLDGNRLDARASAILAACKGFAYVEVSPSQRGLKGFVLAPLNLRGTSGNVEVYDANRFFTVTGRALVGYNELRQPGFDELCQLREALLAQGGVEEYTQQPGIEGESGIEGGDLDTLPIAAYADPERVKKNILRFLNPAGMAYEHWIEVGMALHHQFGGSDTGLDLWDEWSAEDEAGYPKRGRKELMTHYSSFAKTRLGKKRITLRTLLQKTHTARHEATKKENQDLCKHEEIPLLVERLTADEVERRFIYISSMDSVADRENPRAVRSFATARNHYAASKAAVGEDGAVTNSFALWKGRAGRETVDTVTWHPGYPLITYDPDERIAFNIYQPFRPQQGKFVQEHANQFARHIRLLFGDRAEDFLDWLAHIEQNPGTLPHQAWLHVATRTGVGRNLIASVLGRVWGNGVAQSFDLGAALEGGFNGDISQRTLVVVDEIREGGTESHRRAQRLKSLITEAVRKINPKFGHQRTEFNCARWLMFSNFRSAIPIEHGDRRIEVVIYDGPPMDESYYADLYAALDNPDFIWSVKQMLATRNISNFNPGSRAKLTKHKQQAISASRSDAVTELVEFTDSYRWPLVSTEILRKQLSGDLAGTAFAKTVEEAGWVRLPGKHRTHLKPAPIPLYVRRENYGEWVDALGSKNDGLPDQQEAASLMQIEDF